MIKEMIVITNGVGPALWLGGIAADYAVTTLSNGGLGTLHKATGRVLPHVMSSLSRSAFDGISGGILNGANLAVGLKTLSVANATLGIAQAGLAVSSAGLAVGLLGLGVGVWSAWNIHKIRHGVERVETKLHDLSNQVGDLRESNWRIEQYVHWQTQHLEQILNYNSAMLGVILNNQDKIMNGLEIIQQQIFHGFNEIKRILYEVENKKEVQELHTQMQTIHNYYRLCSFELSANRMPPSEDLREIINRSVVLRSWLQTRIGEYSVGSPQRLPYFVGQALALRQEIDARCVLDHAPGARDDDRMVLRQQISEELRTLKNNTLFQRAVSESSLIEHYIYLKRALAKSSPATLVEFMDGNVVPYYPSSTLLWDDHLSTIRKISNNKNKTLSECFDISSLSDQKAWRNLCGMVTGQSYVSSDILQKVLGIKYLSKEEFQCLLDFARLELQKSEKSFIKELNNE